MEDDIFFFFEIGLLDVFQQLEALEKI